jgi:hypothetical protein
MKKFGCFLSCILCAAIVAPAAHAANGPDTADPLYLTKLGDFLSNSNIYYGRDKLRLSQKFSYGFSDRFSMGADIKYQQDFAGTEDGFSNVGLSGVYRVSSVDAESGTSKITSDFLFGINFGGNTRVREPEFADTIYMAGFRVGRAWERLTLSGTVKTSWIFDENRGMAYIDLLPEAYFRIDQDWKIGAGLDLRKSTNPHFNAESVNMKLVRQYGNTQYIGHFDYEFENDEFQIGFMLNILF